MWLCEELSAHVLIFLLVLILIVEASGFSLFDYLRDSENIVDIIHGSGRNKFLLVKSESSLNLRYTIHQQLINELKSNPAIKVTIQQWPDSAILAIPVMGTVKNDLEEHKADTGDEIDLSYCTGVIGERNRLLREKAIAAAAASGSRSACSTTEYLNIPGGSYGRSGNVLIEFTHGLWLAKRVNRTLSIPLWMYRVIEPFNTSLLSSLFCFRIGLDPSAPGVDVQPLDSGVMFFGAGLFADERFKAKLPPLPRSELNGTLLRELSAHFVSVYLALWSSPSNRIVKSSCEVIKRRLDDSFSFASAHKRSFETACSRIMSDTVHIDEFNNAELPMNSLAWKEATYRHPLCGEGMTLSFVEEVLNMHNRGNRKLFILFDGQSEVKDFIGSNATILSVDSTKLFAPVYSIGFGMDTMLIEMYLAMHGDFFIMNPGSTLSLQVFIVRAALRKVSVPTLRDHDIYLRTRLRAAMVWVTYAGLLNETDALVLGS